MAENAHRRHLPFEEFINFNLDMAGIDGISFETVAQAMRDTLRSLPADPERDPVYPDLDRLQATLRTCLNLEIIDRVIRNHPHLGALDPDDLNAIISTAMTLSYLCYNQLAERFGFERPELTQSREEVQRLWSTLRAASGWVNKAASEGDAIAAGMARDITRTLESIQPPNASNNTRNLPG